MIVHKVCRLEPNQNKNEAKIWRYTLKDQQEERKAFLNIFEGTFFLQLVVCWYKSMIFLRNVVPATIKGEHISLP